MKLNLLTPAITEQWAQSHADLVRYTAVVNQLTARMQRQQCRVALCGVGSGLGLLLCLQAWLHSAPVLSRLHIVALESAPASRAQWVEIQSTWPALSEMSAELLAHYPALLPGWRDVWLFDGRVRITFWFGELSDGLTQFDQPFDAWLIERVPAQQAAMVRQVSRLSRQDSVLHSLNTAVASVADDLKQAGFHVDTDKVTGLIKGRMDFIRSFSHKAPWFARPESPIKTGEAVVVGAGLAGAAVAYELAEAGWNVTVLDAAEQPAAHASGNLAGALYPLIAADWNLRSQWYLQGFEATLRRLQPWVASGDVVGELDGLVQLAVDKLSRQRMDDALQTGLPASFCRRVSAAEASELVGGRVVQDGVFFSQGGWLNPPSVVQRCLQHPRISVQFYQTVTQLQQLQQGWQVSCQHAVTKANNIRHADVVVVATGALSNLNELLGVPIRPLKGQVSHVNANHQAWCLTRPISHRGYSAPTGDGNAVTGASFEAPSLDSTLSSAAHLTNLQMVTEVVPDWLLTKPHAAELSEQLDGRVGFRPATLDHLPIVGPVADASWLATAYLQQPSTHAVYCYPEQRYQAGLYVSNGHGARGLASVFLAAQMIVADIQGAAAVVPQALYQATHPARFTIKNWRKGVKATASHLLNS